MDAREGWRVGKFYSYAVSQPRDVCHLVSHIEMKDWLLLGGLVLNAKEIQLLW